MKPAKFEEREYELYLYNELRIGNNKCWSPGQVFEHRLGFDFTVFYEDEFIFRHNRPTRMWPGLFLKRLRLSDRMRQGLRLDEIPNFRFNLFLQTKRSYWSSKPKKLLFDRGFRGIHWSFPMDEEQQRTLVKLSERINRRALIVYAAPAFHERSDLFGFYEHGVIVENSTFPSISVLKNHQNWYYKEPGAKGVANHDPEEINELTIYEKVNKLLQSEGESKNNYWADNIKALAKEIEMGLREDGEAGTDRRAIFFYLLNSLSQEFVGAENSELFRAYFTIEAFCEAFTLDWVVLG